MKTKSISLITAPLVLLAVLAAVAQVGPDDWYFEIDGDYGSLIRDQVVEPGTLPRRYITDGEDPNRHDTYASKNGDRRGTDEPACTDWYHISGGTYMGAQAYRVEAQFPVRAPDYRRSEQMLLNHWKTGADSARYFTLAFRFSTGPLPEEAGGFIAQLHHGSSGGPPIFLAWHYAGGRYYLRCGINKDSPTNPTVTLKRWFYVDPAVPGVWYRMLFQVDPGPSPGWPGCEECPTDQGLARAWMMNPTTGDWERPSEGYEDYQGQIGYWWRYDDELYEWVYRTDNDVSYQWKVGHYSSEIEEVTLDYDNVAYGKRWNNITKNRLIGYKKSVLNLKFDEGTGTAANDDCWSWNGGQRGDATMDYDNDGWLVGSVARSTDGIGFWRRSLYFSGGYVNVPLDTTDFDFGNYVTVSAWFKTTTNAATTQGLVSIDSDDGVGKLFLARSDARVSFGVRHPDDTYSEVGYDHAPGLYTDGQWHHVVGTFNRFTDDNRRVKLYVDGVRVFQRAGYDKPILRGDTRLVVGRLGGSGAFIGNIDEVNVLNYTMTDADVAALMAQNATATRIWDGGSPSTGTWTADANWQGNIQPAAGDFLIFPAGALRPSNTNTFSPDTVFGGIIFQGDNYNIYGNAITLTNHITAQAGASGNTFRPGIRLGAQGYFRAQGSGLQLTLLGNIDLSGRDLALVCQPGQLVCGGIISGTGDVTKSGSGRAVFSGISGNTYSGTTYVLDGFLDLSKYLLINPGGIRLGRVAVPGNLVIGLGTSSLISDAVVCNANNQIAMTAHVTVNATGELNLNGYNNTIGSLHMAGGHVTSGDGTLTVTGNIVGNVDDDGSVISGNLNLGPNGKNVILNDDARLTISAVVSGAAGAPLQASGGGELRLTANNTYAGQTVLHSGAVRVSTPGGLGAGDTVTIEEGELTLVNTAINGKTLRALGPGAIISEGLSCAWNGDVVVEDNLFVSTGAGSTLIWPGQISGPGGFTKGGVGVLRLSGPAANTFTGGVLLLSGVMELYKFFNGNQVPAISGSTLSVGDTFGGPGADIVRYGGPGQIGDATFVRMTSSGKIQLVGWTDLIGALFSSSGGEVDLGLASGRLTVGGSPSSTTFAGVFSGSGSLVKTGLSTLTLTGASTHTGNTVVGQGTLLVHGQLSPNSLVQVQAGGTLGGTGRVHNVSVSNGGRLSPGASAGQLTASDVQLASGTLNIELNGTAPATGYDRLTANGAVALGGDLDVSLGLVSAPGNSFVILDKASPGAISGTFEGLPEGKRFDRSGARFEITYIGGDGNDVALTLIAFTTPKFTLFARTGTNTLMLQAQGAPNVTYVLEAAAHLNTPIPWQPISTNAADSAGRIEFITPAITVQPAQFYRLAAL